MVLLVASVSDSVPRSDIDSFQICGQAPAEPAGRRGARRATAGWPRHQSHTARAAAPSNLSAARGRQRPAAQLPQRRPAPSQAPSALHDNATRDTCIRHFHRPMRLCLCQWPMAAYLQFTAARPVVSREGVIRILGLLLRLKEPCPQVGQLAHMLRRPLVQRQRQLPPVHLLCAAIRFHSC